MARYLGPKVKLSRRVGVPIADIPKHTAKRQLTPPGPHGFRGRRLKDYGVRLVEKQKLRYHYNVLEKQFRRYVAKASRLRGNTGEVLLQLLRTTTRQRSTSEQDLFAQFGQHGKWLCIGHVLVNGKKVDRPSLAVATW